jgi:hypothetical protein
VPRSVKGFLNIQEYRSCRHFIFKVVALGPQLILDCRWYAPLLTRPINTQLRYAELEVELLDVTGRRLVAEAAGDLWSK